jgi:IMP and pyridine-specific 5'-nucleotidase
MAVRALHFGFRGLSVVSARHRAVWRGRARSTSKGPCRSLHSFNEPLIREEFQLHEIVQGWVNNDRMGIEAAFEEMEQRVAEHIRNPTSSRLHAQNPGINKYGRFFTELPLLSAYREMNGRMPIAKREHVPLSFHEVRHVFNYAQLEAIAPTLELLTFDGDKTLYDDRSALGRDSALVQPLVDFLVSGKSVALVTAVGSKDPKPFEDRLKGLLAALRSAGSDEENLFVVGGQCNYLYRHKRGRLRPVPDSEWKDPLVAGWDSRDIRAFLDLAAETLTQLCQKFKLEVTLVRKPFATGVLYVGETSPSLPLFLDEVAFEVRDRLQDQFSPAGLRLSSNHLPFCTFNGGLDVFVDVGSKAVGIRSLQKYLGLVDTFFQDNDSFLSETIAAHTLHVGDQFTRAGNDLLARKVASTLWVSDPEETFMFIDKLSRETI